MNSLYLKYVLGKMGILNKKELNYTKLLTF